MHSACSYPQNPKRKPRAGPESSMSVVSISPLMSSSNSIASSFPKKNSGAPSSNGTGRAAESIGAAPSNYSCTVNGVLSVDSTIVPRGIFTLPPRVKIEAAAPTLAPVLAPELPPTKPPRAAPLAVRPTVLPPSPLVCAVRPVVAIGNSWSSIMMSVHSTDSSDEPATRPAWLAEIIVP